METTFIGGLLYVGIYQTTEYMAEKVIAMLIKPFHLWFNETLCI